MIARDDEERDEQRRRTSTDLEIIKYEKWKIKNQEIPQAHSLKISHRFPYDKRKKWGYGVRIRKMPD